MQPWSIPPSDFRNLSDRRYLTDVWLVSGDSEDVSPTYYKDGDADVAGVPSGVSARPQQPHECAAAICLMA